mgnify:FL=1
MRIGEACRAAAAQLRTAGVPDPAWDSGQLMSRVTGLAPLTARLSERELTAEEAAAFDALVQRRLQREPLQYILGTQDFCGRSFAVDGRVLIPRPETELLAERAVRALQDFGPGAHALDLCCGSGCLGITLALEAPSAQVDMADLSEDALAVTRKNAERLGAQVSLLRGDLWGAVDARQYQLIVSNPPYIPDEDCLALQAEVMREPPMALKGGMDGLDFYRRIAAGLRKHLLPGGVLLLEVGFDQAERVAELLRAAGCETACHEDYQHILRMVEARWA